MDLYLDDHLTDKLLIGLLRKSGHQVVLPADLGRSGVADARHLLAAAQRGLALVSRNYKDFEPLHELVVGLGGQHAGILLVRDETVPARNMKAGAIATAVNKYAAANPSAANQLVTLNHWR
jgi:hypothetical protein